MEESITLKVQGKGKGAKAKRREDGCLCNKISTSSMPYWAHSCEGGVNTGEYCYDFWHRSG
nr:hypothetical protein Iba_chr02fCG12780 [Ipomoea batatas]